jgi:CDP-6-deoxy-D-xylo-4-hexulose-3-dehydrase
MDEIVDLCERHGVVLIEDNCESIGSMYKGEMLGSFGEMSLFSFYYGHHISTIEGGMINTNDKSLYEMLLAQRCHGWSRDVGAKTKVAWREQYGVDPFNDLYTFYYSGLNVRATDLQAFLGLRMLDKIGVYSGKRNSNFFRYLDGIRGNLLNIGAAEWGFTSNFAYPMASNNRADIIRDLAAAGVETRPLIAGNMGRQPLWTRENGVAEFPNADLIHSCGFYLPNHQDLTIGEIDEIIRIVTQYA